MAPSRLSIHPLLSQRRMHSSTSQWVQEEQEEVAILLRYLHSRLQRHKEAEYLVMFAGPGSHQQDWDVCQQDSGDKANDNGKWAEENCRMCR